MTERWKRELSKIDEIEPEEGLLDRARLGPTRGALQPSRASRVGTVVLAFAAVALAGVLLVRAFGWPGGTTDVASEATPTMVTDSGPMPWMAVLQEQPRLVRLAAYTGQLVERNGCLMMGEGERTLPVWPKGFSMMQSGGETLVVDEQGRPVGAVGSDIRMGGGQVPWRDGIDALEEAIGEPIPEACLADLINVWMVGETHPLAPTLTPEIQGALLDRARQYAADNGDPESVRTYAVVTEARNVVALDPGLFAGADPVPDMPWVVVQMYGDFTSYAPGTTEDAKGSALWFAMPLTDPLPLEAAADALVAVPLDLKQLGDPVQIDLVPDKNPPLEVSPKPAQASAAPPATGTREDVEKVWLLLNEAQSVFDDIAELEASAHLTPAGEARLTTRREQLRYLLEQAAELETTLNLPLGKAAIEQLGLPIVSADHNCPPSVVLMEIGDGTGVCLFDMTPIENRELAIRASGAYPTSSELKEALFFFAEWQRPT